MRVWGSADILAVLEGCRRGEQAAWGSLQQWFSRVSTSALSPFCSLGQADRDEAAETAFGKIMTEIQASRVKAAHPGEFVNFVRITVRRCALDIIRQRRPQDEVRDSTLEVLVDGSSRPDTLTELRSRLDCIEHVISTWSTDEKLIFMLKINGTSSNAIQNDLSRLSGVHVTANAIDVRFHHQRKRLEEACP